MLFIFSFFKNLNSKAIISYILTLGTLVLVYLLTVIADAADIKNYIAILISCVLCLSSVFIILPFVPYGISTGRKDIKLFLIGRYIGTIFTFFMINIAVSFGICFAVIGVLGGILFQEDQRLASLIIKSILYIIFLLVLYTLTSYHGRTDTEKKVFNPHTVLQSVVLAHAFMLPHTRFDWFNYNELGRSLFYNSQTFLSEFEFIRNLGEAGFIMGYIITSLVTCFFALFFCNMGRNSFFKKHPSQLLYDSVEVNSIKNKNNNTVDFTDVI